MRKKNNRPTFVVSTGRSGSKMVANILATHPEIFALHEPRPRMNLEAYSSWMGKIDQDKIKNSVIHKRMNIIDQVDKNNLLYLESSHFCSHLIPILYESFDAQFIHLVRDGRNFLISGLNREWWYSDRIEYHLIEKLIDKLKVFVRRRLFIDIGHEWHDHRLNPPKRYRTKLEKITWLWVEINSVILESLKNLPVENQLTIRLEDFSESKIYEISDFIKVNIDKELVKKMYLKSLEKPNKSANKVIRSFDQFEDVEKKAFWKIANQTMTHFGYLK